MKLFEEKKDNTKHDICCCTHADFQHTLDAENKYTGECEQCQCPKYVFEQKMTSEEVVDLQMKMEKEKHHDTKTKEDKNQNGSYKVLEAYTRDVGRGIVRIDYDTMDSIGASTGEPLVLSLNDKETGAKTLPLYPSDEGKQILRIDGIVRENLGVEIGDHVKIKKIKIHQSDKVSVIPLEAIPPIDERYLSDALEGIVIRVDDKVMVPYFGGRLAFRVIDIGSEKYGLVTQKTVFSILEGPASIYLQNLYGLIDQEKKEIMKNTAESMKDMNDTKQLFELITKAKDEIKDLESLKPIAEELLNPRDKKFKDLSSILEEALTNWLKIQKERKK